MSLLRQSCGAAGTLRYVVGGVNFVVGPPAARISRLAIGGVFRLVLAALAVAALSLLLVRQPTYDPTAWLIWGREILHGGLSTTGGPSWKPLPMLVTIPAAVLDKAGQQDAWLVVARAGGLLALALAYRLGARLGGRTAGVLAAAGLLLSSQFVSFVLRGNSEGLLVALVLGGVEALIVRRSGPGFALLTAAALLRPELWPVVAAVGLWLLARAPRERRPVILLGLVVVGAGILVLWLVPERLGSGDFLRAASRAREPVPGSPAQAAVPFLATFTNAAPVIPWPLYLGGFLLVGHELGLARRARRLTPALWIAVLATLQMVTVAAMAQGGFTGNSRYLAVPIALTSVLGGAGLAWAARALGPRLRGRRASAVVVAAVVVAAPFFVLAGERLRDQVDTANREARSFDELPAAIAAAGGRAAVLACGGVITTPFDTQALARALDVEEHRVGIVARPPDTVVVRRGQALSRAPGLRVLAVTPRWVVASSCPR